MAKTKRWSFTVPGRPSGYYAAGKFPNYSRQAAYTAYKQHVAVYADRAGVDRQALRESRKSYIHTVAYFENGVHPDPENVRKGISDALFYVPRGMRKGAGDKYCGGSFETPRYDKEDPRVEVVVEIHLDDDDD